jgi:hypothetical protein
MKNASPGNAEGLLAIGVIVALIHFIGRPRKLADWLLWIGGTLLAVILVCLGSERRNRN